MLFLFSELDNYSMIIGVDSDLVLQHQVSIHTYYDKTHLLRHLVCSVINNHTHKITCTSFYK